MDAGSIGKLTDKKLSRSDDSPADGEDRRGFECGQANSGRGHGQEENRSLFLNFLLEIKLLFQQLNVV